MATTIKLYYVDRNSTYKEWELIPSRLLIIEDFSYYLATKSALTVNNFQYIKNELELSINVDLSQTYSQAKTSTSFKYVSIQNEGELIHYYFVKKATWRSKTCVRFDLVLDVLNTYQENYDYTFKANTKIIREHKDRFTSVRDKITINYFITLQVGTLNTDDEVRLINDHGDIVFTGKVYNIDQYMADIEITSGESETEISTAIDDFIEDDFQLEKKSDPSIYYMVSISTYSFSHQTYRVIDYVSEGINPVLIRKTTPVNIQESGILKQDWYLLYRNQNDPSDSLVNPVDCYLIPQNETKTAYAYIQNGRIIPSWLESDSFYYFHVSGTTVYTLSNGVTISDSDASHKTTMVISRSDDKIYVQVVRAIYNSTVQVIGVYVTDYISISSVPVNYNEDIVFMDTNYLNYYTNITYPESFTNSGTETKLDPITKLERSDSKNIKLIKLPYIPFKFTVSSDTIQINANWEFTSLSQSLGGNMNCLRLKSSNTKLENTINAHDENPFSNLRVLSLNPNLNDLRRGISSALESKLFHSDFYQPSYVYDSFTLNVALEKCDLDYYVSNGTTGNQIKFNMTNTINSKFMFTLTRYSCDKATENFYNVLTVARNNEVVLYNVPYINWIRNGYNYEIKSKNLQTASNLIGLGLSAASIGTALALPSAPLKAAGVVASLVSMATSVKNTIVTVLSNENSINQKIQQYKNQTASVSGSDDVDLMSEYCDNRLKYFIYEPNEVMKNLLNDLFFYAGYSSNRMGIPKHNTRNNFDYLECDASIEKISPMPDECLAELINCFKNGVTYIHHTLRATNPWDIAQQYENWEKSLL